ncbi:MAG: hypothetical protein ACXVBF_02450 [Flavisolibacter sp.]
MSLNNIQLKNNLLADLYKDSLVETSATAMPEKKPMKYLGNNQKQVIVVVSHDNVPFLPDGELSFLTNVLAACKMSIADIGIINSNRSDESELQSIIDVEARDVILFGVEPPEIGLPINFPAFQLQAFNNRTYVKAPTLSEIEADKTLKGSLWTSLKGLFKI